MTLSRKSQGPGLYQSSISAAEIGVHRIGALALAHCDAGPAELRVLAAFENYVYLVIERETPGLLILSPAGARMGPLSLMLADWPNRLFLDHDRGRIRDQKIEIGNTQIHFGNATVWNSSLTTAPILRPVSVLDRLRPLLNRNIHQSQLLGAVVNSPTIHGYDAFDFSALQAGLADGDDKLLFAGARSIAGLGQGLTPSGDDFLCGVMTAVWLFDSTPEAICTPIFAGMEGQTTTLSTGLARAIAAGHVNQSWLDFLCVLAVNDRPKDLKPALMEVLSVGASSGADLMAGFLWASHCFALGPSSAIAI